MCGGGGGRQAEEGGSDRFITERCPPAQRAVEGVDFLAMEALALCHTVRIEGSFNNDVVVLRNDEIVSRCDVGFVSDRINKTNKKPTTTTLNRFNVQLFTAKTLRTQSAKRVVRGYGSNLIDTEISHSTKLTTTQKSSRRFDDCVRFQIAVT